MPFVKVAYDRELWKIGTTIEVDEDTARQMVSDGHGRIVRKPSGAAAKKAPAKTAATGKPPAAKTKPTAKRTASSTKGSELGENGVTAVASAEQDPAVT